MFVSYLIYKKSWIGFVVLLLLLTNTLLFVDSGIQVELDSILYLNGLFLLLSIVFLLVQYKKETSYYKILRSQMNEVDEGGLNVSLNRVVVFRKERCIPF